MSRPLRIELASGLYHVTSRGDRREDIYFSDADRLAWLKIYSQVCKRFNWVCHAWCQMSNHYHIVVETVEGNLSEGMRQLNGVYTQYINRTYNRVGHVFQGRFKGILVERDTYLLELARYVVLNPVRAGMVADTGDWAWSSYHAMVGQEGKPEWLNTDWLLGQFGSERRQAIAGYIDFVRGGVGLPSLWGELKGQIYLGTDAYIEHISKLGDANSLNEVPRKQRRPLAKPLTHYVENYKTAKEGMVAAYATGDYTMQQIATAFDVHYSTVSRAIKWDEMLDCKT